VSEDSFSLRGRKNHRLYSFASDGRRGEKSEPWAAILVQKMCELEDSLLVSGFVKMEKWG